MRRPTRASAARRAAAASEAVAAVAAVAEPPVNAAPAPSGDIDPALFFDAWSYLDLHADVRHAQQSDPEFDVLAHCLRHGIPEGRAPSFLFDVPHVAAALREREGLALDGPGVLDAFCRLPPDRRFVPNRWFDPWAMRLREATPAPGGDHASDWELFARYVARAGEDGLSPNALFDEAAYLSRNPDVAAAVRGGQQRSGFAHFLVTGFREERLNLPGLDPWVERRGGERAVVLRENDPDERPVGWHDERFYRAAYPDVDALLRAGTIRTGLEHYLAVGIGERRVPHPSAFAWETMSPDDGAPGVFDPRTVVETLPRRLPIEVASHLFRRLEGEAGAALGAAGRGRLAAALWPHVELPAVNGHFDAPRYLALHPDVAADRASADALGHWRTRGAREGRLAPGSNPFSNRRIDVLDVAAWVSEVNVFADLAPAATPDPTPDPASESAREPAPAARPARAAAPACRSVLAVLAQARIPHAAIDTGSAADPGSPPPPLAARDLRGSINLFVLDPARILDVALTFGTAIFNGRVNIALWSTALPAVPPVVRAASSALDLILVATEAEQAAFSAVTDRTVAVLPVAPDADGGTRAGGEAGARRRYGAIDRARAAGRRIVLVVEEPGLGPFLAGHDILRDVAAIVARDARDPRRRALFVFPPGPSGEPGTDAAAVAAEPAAVAETLVLATHDADGAVYAELLARADLCIAAPRAISSSTTLLQAAAAGARIACPRHAGGLEHLRPGAATLVASAPVPLREAAEGFPAGSVCFETDRQDLARAVAAILASPTHRSEGALSDEVAAAALGRRLRSMLKNHAAFGAERALDTVTRFTPIASVSKDELLDMPRPAGAPRPTTDPDADAADRARVAASLSPMFGVVTLLGEHGLREIGPFHAALVEQGFGGWEWCAAALPASSAAQLAAIGRHRRSDARIRLVRAPGGTDALAGLVRQVPEEAGDPGAEARRAAFERALLFGSGTHVVRLGAGIRLGRGLLETLRAGLAAADGGDAPAALAWRQQGAEGLAGIVLRKDLALAIVGTVADPTPLALHDAAVGAGQPPAVLQA